jgi:uridine phosphorylase
MEASVILVLAKIWGLRAGGIATSVINVLNPSGEEGEYDPEKDFAHSTENIKSLALMGSEAVCILAKMDGELK